MVLKEACIRLTKLEQKQMWMERLESVDRAIERSNTGWGLDFWNNVRRKLVQQLVLINADVR
jgi:hypothetical protein